MIDSQPAYANPEVDPIQSFEADLRQRATLHLGARTIKLSDWKSVVGPNELISNSSGIAETDNMKNTPNNLEGHHNAELFKQAYDTVIESIEKAFEADGSELSNRLVVILSSIDALGGTPYISSVPEFVDLVNGARRDIEQANTHIRLDSSPEATLAVASALSRAKQQIAATAVAYQP